MEYQKQVVTWACGVLNQLQVHFESSEQGWDIMTVDGWISVETPGALAQVATSVQRKQMAGKNQASKHLL